MHRTHRSAGSVLALLIVLWFASGAVMTFSGYPRFTETERLALAPALPRAASIELPAALQRHLASAKPDGSRVRLAMHEGEPTWLYNGVEGARVALRAEPEASFSPLDEARVRYEASERFGLPVRAVQRLDESDQWTVAIAKPGNMPLYRVYFGDASSTEAYLSARSGETVQATTRTERVLAWLGAIPHWIYPTILRRERELWRYTVFALSAAGLLITVSGTVAGIHVWRATRKRKGPRDPYLRWHQWLGLWFGLFASTWLFSGAMSLTPFQWTGGRGPSEHEQAALYQHATVPSAAAVQRALALCQRDLTVRELELSPLGGRLYAVCADAENQTRVVDLTDAVAVSRALLPSTAIATLAARLAGPDRERTTELASAYDSYYYPTHSSPDAALPYFRVSLQDDEASTYYIDPARARLLRKYTHLTRLERWLYQGLHSFDIPGLYQHRVLWRTLVIGAMALGVGLSGLGFWMTVRRWRRASARKRKGAPNVRTLAPRAERQPLP